MNASLLNLLTHRQFHKLLGVALGGLGMSTGITTSAGWRELLIPDAPTS